MLVIRVALAVLAPEMGLGEQGLDDGHLEVQLVAGLLVRSAICLSVYLLCAGVGDERVEEEREGFCSAESRGLDYYTV